MNIDRSGPISWRNWRACEAGMPLLGTVELSLFSDAWFIGDARDHGPYAFLNAVPFTGRDGMYAMKPAIILRVQDYMEDERPDMSITHDEDYHGGWLFDEIAALTAVILGARIMAGPVEREFGFDWADQDPLGRPRAHTPDLLPWLPPSAKQPQISDLQTQKDLRQLSRLSRFPRLEPEVARTLIKSSRLYQQALWIADTAPEMAWLLLVAAMEAAAVQWDQTVSTPVERLQRTYPQLGAALSNSSDPLALGMVADALSRLTRATGKFVDFSVKFAPRPPVERPQWGRLDFSPAALKKALSKIYTYRSRALHEGTPIPHPMCYPPFVHGNDVPEEVPAGLASGSLGSTWLAEDTPMLLHTFAYITRGTLLNWWTSIDPEAVELENGPDDESGGADKPDLIPNSSLE